jgi:hypothetical protein
MKSTLNERASIHIKKAASIEAAFLLVLCGYVDEFNSSE